MVTKVSKALNDIGVGLPVRLDYPPLLFQGFAFVHILEYIHAT